MYEKKPREGQRLGRRQFMKQAVVLSSLIIVPSYVLGGKNHVAPSDRITLGFIGNGRQGNGLLSQFLKIEEVQVLATSDVYKEKCEAARKRVNTHYAKQLNISKYDICKAYHDFRDLLGREDIDAVVIASPDFWHAVHVVLSADAGKDIYCEKPLAHTIKEGRAMVDAVKRNNRILQTGSMQRSWDEFRQAVELVRNGYIGEIKMVKVDVGGPPRDYDLEKELLPDGLDWNFWLGPNNKFDHYNNRIAPSLDADFWAEWREFKAFGGGYFADWGAHMFDIVQWALNMDKSGPTKIYPPNNDGYTHLTFRYANGITMTHEDFGLSNAIRFVGTKGQIDVQRGMLKTSPESLKDLKLGSNDERVYYSDNHYQNWIDAIKERSSPICDVETGHRSSTVCNLGNIAYELKEALTWDPIKESFIQNEEANKLCGKEMRRPWNII